LCAAAWQHWCLPRWLAGVLLALVVTGEGIAAMERAYVWGDPLRFAEVTLRWAPNSERAWLALGGCYFDMDKSHPGRGYLDRAIETNAEAGAKLSSVMALSNVVIYRTIKGDVAKEDWSRFLELLQTAPMSSQNVHVLWVMLDNVDRGMALDKEDVAQMVEIMGKRTTFSASEYLRLGAFLHNETRQPYKALPYLRRAVEMSPSGDPDITRMLAELREVGLEDWASELERTARPASNGK